jgi:hypothetical protein
VSARARFLIVGYGLLMLALGWSSGWLVAMAVGHQ